MESVKTIASLGEFGLIESILAPSTRPAGKWVELGVGDDAAVLNIPRTQQLLVTTDTLMEGVHFNSDSDPYLLAQKALRVNLSDIAAMGGVPHWYQLSLGFRPSIPLPWVEEFARGLREAEREFEVTLVGGDTVGAKGCLSITLTMLGLVGQGRALTRKGAIPGDLILVSGSIGDSALGFSHASGRLSGVGADDAVFFERRHQLPTPRLGLAKGLMEACLAHACIDVSDGLAADLGHICRMSKVSARVDLASIPHSEAASRQMALHGPGLQEMLISGGEDYELVIAAAAGALEQIQAVAAGAGVPITVIGEFLPGPGQAAFFRHGEEVRLRRKGWTHF